MNDIVMVSYNLAKHVEIILKNMQAKSIDLAKCIKYGACMDACKFAAIIEKQKDDVNKWIK